MSATTRVPSTATEVRRRNQELDQALLEVAAELDPALLHHAPADGGWSAAQVMAHLREFPQFFAGELSRWLEDRGAVVGRTHEHWRRLAAVAPARTAGTDHEALLAGMRCAFSELGFALERLRDADLTATTINVKYGAEPLTAFLERYVLGHKEGHLAQLRALKEE
jgi:DinB superfamily